MTKFCIPSTTDFTYSERMKLHPFLFNVKINYLESDIKSFHVKKHFKNWPDTPRHIFKCKHCSVLLTWKSLLKIYEMVH